tara:strand:- start:18219 stop:18632 length:414 start_codon:yes stop_codon:yes gene_type:complete
MLDPFQRTIKKDGLEVKRLYLSHCWHDCLCDSCDKEKEECAVLFTICGTSIQVCGDCMQMFLNEIDDSTLPMDLFLVCWEEGSSTFYCDGTLRGKTEDLNEARVYRKIGHAKARRSRVSREYPERGEIRVKQIKAKA